MNVIFHMGGRIVRRQYGWVYDRRRRRNGTAAIAAGTRIRNGVTRIRLKHNNRFAIKLGICKQTRCVTKIEDGEIEFVVVLTDTGSAADNLLELRHSVLTELVVEHDYLTRLAINTSGEKLRSRNDGRVFLVGVDEVI